MVIRALLILCVVAAGCYGIQAQGKSSDELIKILTAPKTSRDARIKASKKLAQKPPGEVLGKLLEVQKKYGHTIDNWGRDEFRAGGRVSWEQAAAITSSYAWSGNLDNPSYSKQEKGTALLELMRAEENVYAKARFLFHLKFNWVDGAELEATSILADSKADPLARYIAGEVLFEVMGLKYYEEIYSAALEARLEENQVGFAELLLRKREPEPDGRVLRYAFAAIQTQRAAHTDRLDHGYGIAVSIGHYLGIEFAKQSDPKYKTENGSAHPTFFIDTVENALKWWESNKSAYQQ
jgi:hypothetical protein